MRYLIQYVLPALIALTLVYLLANRTAVRVGRGEGDRDLRVFITLFLVGAAVAAALGYLLYAYLES